MSRQFFEKLLDSFKRSNSNRKADLAMKAGYKTIEEYKAFLESHINGSVNVTPTEKPTIHIVDIIDCSDSMRGPKIKGAVEGINNGVSELKKDTIANYTYTLCDFSGRGDANYSQIKTPIDRVSTVYFTTRNMTALYDAIDNTLDILEKQVNADEKVLINIYTDGQDNQSKLKASDIAKRIERLKVRGYTVTFIGTNSDTDFIVKNMGVDESNTLKYDGSGEGLTMSMQANSASRSAYATKVAAGEDVSKGFYKDIK